MARFINPFTDVGFKRIFGQEINKDLLIDFLNGLLEGEKHIVDIRFLDKEVLPAFAQDRGVIYDVYCTNESGEQFIVEMQNRPQVNFAKGRCTICRVPWRVRANAGRIGSSGSRPCMVCFS